MKAPYPESFPDGPVPLDILLEWWTGGLTPALRDAVELRLMEDDDTARRVEALAALGAGVVQVLRSGALSAGVTADTLARLAAAGVAVRVHEVPPGGVTPCAIAHEPVVAVRLLGPFDVDAVEMVVTYRREGAPPDVVQLHGVPVDHASGEVILVFPGDPIRAMPRTLVEVVASRPDGTRIGVFQLDHHPT